MRTKWTTVSTQTGASLEHVRLNRITRRGLSSYLAKVRSCCPVVTTAIQNWWCWTFIYTRAEWPRHGHKTSKNNSMPTASQGSTRISTTWWMDQTSYLNGNPKVKVSLKYLRRSRCLRHRTEVRILKLDGAQRRYWVLVIRRIAGFGCRMVLIHLSRSIQMDGGSNLCWKLFVRMDNHCMGSMVLKP